MESGQFTSQLLAVSSSPTYLYIEIYYKKLFPDCKITQPKVISRDLNEEFDKAFHKMLLLRRSSINQWFGFTKN